MKEISNIVCIVLLLITNGFARNCNQSSPISNKDSIVEISYKEITSFCCLPFGVLNQKLIINDSLEYQNELINKKSNDGDCKNCVSPKIDFSKSTLLLLKTSVGWGKKPPTYIKKFTYNSESKKYSFIVNVIKYDKQLAGDPKLHFIVVPKIKNKSQIEFIHEVTYEL